MINVLDSVKQLYKSDSVMKKYFVVFRDYGQMKDNSQISSESLNITESICSSGNFKVGLCESASCKLSVLLDDNVNNDEITVFQVLGDFEPEIINPDITRDSLGRLETSLNSTGVELSGSGVTKLTTTFTSTNIISGLDSVNFATSENYLVLAKLKYIGNPIYLYTASAGNSSRMIYYLKAGLYNFNNSEPWDNSKAYAEGALVTYDDDIWESRTYDNEIEPGTDTNAWTKATRYVQVAIPIVGNEFSYYKKGIYANQGQEYGTLEGTADIYKLDFPIMPLGIFTVKSCKRRNDGRIRNLVCYDRMQDVGLDTDIYFTGSTNIQMGQILDQAASGTQIVIGNNLSKEGVNPTLLLEEDISINNFPTGNIYQVDKTETKVIQGTYSEIQSSDCTLDHTRTEQKTLNGNYKNGGNYSHTQMQIIDGTLDETATNSNKEFSTTLRKTIKSNSLIDSDNSNWNTYRNNGTLRQVGTRRQTYSTNDTQTQVQSKYYMVDGYWDTPSGPTYAENYKVYDGSYDWDTMHITRYISGPTVEEEINPDWKYNQNSTITRSGKTYSVLSLGTITQGSWTGRSYSSTYDRYIQTKTNTRTVTFKYDTTYGYVYNNLPGWIIQNSEYYTGIADSTWVNTSGNKIKSAAYIDLYKTLYWKYTWDALATKTSYDTNWTAYGSGTTFQYQSQSSGSGTQYPLSSARPSPWYTQLNTVYSDAAVYKKMSRRYTRTHTYDYTFADAGAGWARYKNANADNYYNYVKDGSGSNKLYTGVTLSEQYRVGIYSDVNVYNVLARDYRRTVAYGYIMQAPEGEGWVHPNDDYNESGDALKYRANSTIDEITQLNDVYNTVWREYTRDSVYTWVETVTGKKVTYEIPSDIYDSSMNYTVYITHPSDSDVYQGEDNIRNLALAQAETVNDTENKYTASGTLTTDRQNLVRDAIISNSTQVTEVGSDRKFYVYYIETLTYTGYVSYNNGTPAQNYNASGILRTANPYQSCVMHGNAEKFNSMPIEWGNQNIHGTKRAVIAGFMEIHGLFINFDRWGVSTTRNVSSSTLYPAENLYPHDSKIPGNESYGDIYPSVGSSEVTDITICKSIYVDDELNNEFDGVVIIKSQVSQSDASLYPFYYNRLTKRYGTLPSGMPEVAHTPWEGNNYYRVENNFFFDNFIFTETQLKEICKQILTNVGDLQYFNLTAKLRALPYMEVGDSIDIMTPQNGYETAILRRVMSGCIAQTDSIETDFS